MASPLPVFRHRLAIYRRTWRGTVLSSFLLPVLLLLGLGISVGSYVDANGRLGVPYADYIAPGLLASTVFQIAVGEATYPVAAGFLWVLSYHAMRATPLRPPDMVGGELLYSGLRAGTAALGFLVVMLLFGVVHSFAALAVLPIALLLALASGAPVLAYSASITHDSMFAILFRFVVIPATLFAGVFFPVEQIPMGIRWLAYALPLWHGVELTRAATLGTAAPWGWAGHVGVLVAWAVAGYLLARLRFTRKLAD